MNERTDRLSALQQQVHGFFAGRSCGTCDQELCFAHQLSSGTSPWYCFHYEAIENVCHLNDAEYFLKKALMRKMKTEAAATRDRILATTSRVVLQHGLATVGMRDLMRAAGLTPGGFYRHFASRDELIAEAIRAAFDRLLAMLETEKASKPQAEQLGHIVGIYLGQSRETIDDTAPFLCPLAQLGAELKHAAPVVQAEGLAGYRRLVKLFAGCFAPCPSSADESRAEVIVSTLVGAVTLANLAPDKENGLGVLNQAKLFVARGT